MGSKHSTVKKQNQSPEAPVKTVSKKPVVSEQPKSVNEANVEPGKRELKRVSTDPPNIQPTIIKSPDDDPVFHVNLSKVGSTDTIVGPNQARKARSFNMTEIDFSITGVSSSFAPVPGWNNEKNNSKEKIDVPPDCKHPPDSPSPKRKAKKQKSDEDSEPPKGYYEAKKQK